jgi:hypothetical protein
MRTKFWSKEETTWQSKRIWEDNSKTGYRAAKCEGVNWTDLAQDRIWGWAVVNKVMTFPSSVDLQSLKDLGRLTVSWSI